MSRYWIAAALLAASACDRQGLSVAAYRNPRDALVSLLPPGFLSLYPCASVKTEEGFEIVESIPVDRCVKMLPARRYKGVWLDEFEGSSFFEDVGSVAGVKAALWRQSSAPLADEWLSWRGEKSPASENASRLVLLDFIGRRTAYPGAYGHFGMSRSQIIVDRVLSARTIRQLERGSLLAELAPPP